jgi:hypothetical protein
MRLEHMHVHHAPTEREKRKERNAHVFSSFFNCVVHTHRHTHGWSARSLSSFIFWNSSSSPFIPPARPRLYTHHRIQITPFGHVTAAHSLQYIAYMYVFLLPTFSFHFHPLFFLNLNRRRRREGGAAAAPTV